VAVDASGPAVRDCAECGAIGGMKLQNVTNTRGVPLFYVCKRCGCTLTIPPPYSALPTR